MWLAALRNLAFGPRSPRPPARQRRRARLLLEPLEDRALPSAYTAGSVADLIADINTANAAGGSNTITLVAGTTFNLTAVDNSTDGATGLPVIAAKDSLTLIGNGDTIARSNGGGTPAFRLLDVAAGATLTLQDLTLQGGLAFGSGVQAEGGAIYNQGTLTLSGVTVQNNTAQGSEGNLVYAGTAAGGGIYSGGSLTVEASTIQNNQALGGNAFGDGNPGDGGWGLGGGVFIAGGTAALDNVTLYSNTAQGGNGASVNGRNRYFSGKGGGGDGLGGGLYAAGGSVSLNSTTVDHNTARGGTGQGGDGVGQGGGLYLAAAASVCLDAFTQMNVNHNSASTSDPDISGSYTTCP
jgi:hypothetical protein